MKTLKWYSGVHILYDALWNQKDELKTIIYRTDSAKQSNKEHTYKTARDKLKYKKSYSEPNSGSWIISKNNFPFKLNSSAVEFINCMYK